MAKTQISFPSQPHYLRVFISIFGSTVGVVLLLNLTVDPFAAYRLVRIQSLDRYKDGLSTRTGKAEAVEHDGWNNLLLGNSRTETGLDPLHPGWGSGKTYNAGIAGTDFNELNLAARIAMKSHNLRLLVLCLDLGDFTPRPAQDDYLHSRLNPQLNVLEYHLDNLLSMRATEKSFSSIRNALQRRPGPDWRMGINEVPIKSHGYSDWTLEGYHDFFASEGRPVDSVVDQTRLKVLRDLLDEAGNNGIRVQLVQLPLHAVAMQRLYLAGLWGVSDQWIRDIVELINAHNQESRGPPVEFWDFATFSKFAIEDSPRPGDTTANMRWFWDPVHFKKALGDYVIDRLTGFPSPPDARLDNFGVILTPQNVEVQLAAISRDRESWANRN